MSETLIIKEHVFDFLTMEVVQRDDFVELVIMEDGLISEEFGITKENAIRLANHLLKISAE
jgi:hypothetical protein